MIQEEWNEQIRQIFIDALEYPLMAIPEFLANKQKECGIYKNYFFAYLKREIKVYKNKLPVITIHERNAANEVNGQSLKDVTCGKVESIYTLDHKTITNLTSNLLSDLKYLIEVAEHYDDKEVVYSDLDIVTFAESTLEYIHNEFEKQVRLRNENAAGTGMYLLLEGEPKPDDLIEHVLYTYHIYEKPNLLLHYLVFEKAVRNLLLNSNNQDGLRRVLRPTYDLGNKVNKLWTDKMYKLEFFAERVKKEDKFIRFDADQGVWYQPLSKSLSLKNSFNGRDYIQFKRRITNYDLAFFAARAANLIAKEVLDGKEKEMALPKKPKQSIYKSFNELFKEEYEDRIEDFIQLLRDTDKPCIDEGYSYNTLSKQKTVFVVWYDALDYKQVIYKDVSDLIEKAQLLNQKFSGLNISVSALKNKKTIAKASNIYRSYFLTEISAIQKKH